MTVAQFIALLLGVVAAVWAVMDRTWQLLILAIAVILLAVSPGIDVHIH